MKSPAGLRMLCRAAQKYLEFNFVTCYDVKKGKPEKRPTL